MARTPERYGAAYLRSAWWGELRDAYDAHPRAPHSCAVCGTPRYQLHHRTYDNLGHEHISDLLALCSAHHERLHKSWRTHHEWHPEDTLAEFTDAWVHIKRREHRNALLPDLSLYAHARRPPARSPDGPGARPGFLGHPPVGRGRGLGDDPAGTGNGARAGGGGARAPQALDGSPG